MARNLNPKLYGISRVPYNMTENYQQVVRWYQSCTLQYDRKLPESELRAVQCHHEMNYELYNVIMRLQNYELYNAIKRLLNYELYNAIMR
ncbi:hypothetical protein Btru_009624 [Bulinus truncatus]|nr:hypothetical protein Btru_009624 [Bulinus truncatus]